MTPNGSLADRRLAGVKSKTTITMDAGILDLMRAYPQASITVNAADLERFGVDLLRRAREEYEAEITKKVIAEREEALLTAREGAKFFSVSTKTVTRWRQARYLVPVAVGGSYKYRKSDCRRILEEKGRA